MVTWAVKWGVAQKVPRFFFREIITYLTYLGILKRYGNVPKRIRMEIKWCTVFDQKWIPELYVRFMVK